MKRTYVAVSLFLLSNLMVSKTAVADWAEPGAAYQCDFENNVFSIKSFMDTSSPESPGTVAALPGYQKIKDGDYVACGISVLPIHSVRANFSVYPPQERGMCGGLTHTYINFLQVDEKLIFLNRESFNSQCINTPELYDIEVKVMGDEVVIKLCYADWSWGKGYTEIYCGNVPYQNRIHNIQEPAPLE